MVKNVETPSKYFRKNIPLLYHPEHEKKSRQQKCNLGVFICAETGKEMSAPLDLSKISMETLGRHQKVLDVWFC